MRKIEDLTVKVTYEVGLGDVDIPDKVYKELLESFYNNRDIETNSVRYPLAEKWLNENIRERDCCQWKAEITELTNIDI